VSCWGCDVRRVLGGSRKTTKTIVDEAISRTISHTTLYYTRFLLEKDYDLHRTHNNIVFWFYYQHQTCIYYNNIYNIYRYYIDLYIYTPTHRYIIIYYECMVCVCIMYTRKKRYVTLFLLFRVYNILCISIFNARCARKSILKLLALFYL